MIEHVWYKKFNVIYKFYPSIYMNFTPNVQLPAMIFIYYLFILFIILFFYLLFYLLFYFFYLLFYFINYIYDVNVLYASNSNLNTSNFDFIS